MAPKRSYLATICAVAACALSMSAASVPPARAQDQASTHDTLAPIDDRALAAALCPIVYEVDHFPSPHGYRYIFYGNGFFINKDGYLLTAAHVLSQLRGGQPSLLLRTPGAPPQFVQATVIAIDRDHDIALLLATPNPFAGNFAVSFLPIDREIPKPGRSVLAADSRPARPRDAYTLDPAVEERSAGQVLDFEFSQLSKGPVDTELFLFGHAVQPGQSGAPVISLDSKEVVGLVEGQWLRDNTTALAAPGNRPSLGGAASLPTSQATPIPGAVIPIHYAISLLQQKGIAWQSSGNTGAADGAGATLSPPAPLSLIPPAYPQWLFGGEVVLDAEVTRAGTISDVRVVHGDEPFLDKALAAVRTWIFQPARVAGRASDARISITLQFAQPYVPPRASTEHHYDADSTPQNAAARPLATFEPTYPASSSADGSVILYESVDRDGKASSVQALTELETLTPAALNAAKEWKFEPATQSGAPVESTAIIVFTFRHPLATGPVTK